MKKKKSITVIGASARAACWSAVRAGLKPRAFDQFRDLDFPPDCEVRLISKEPDTFFSEAAKAQHEPCLPVGGWENDTEMMQRLESNFSLWNTNSTMTKLARDPLLVQQILRKHDLPNLKVRTACNEPAGGEWIRKPIAGTGGIGIQRISSASTECGADQYDQQFVRGESYSVIFFASQTGEIRLLGITQQLIGCDELPHRPFAYVGSVGPVLSGDNARERTIRSTLQKMADTLNKQIKFYGLFCFDFIVSQNIPYLVEINPRYSASIEVLELALQKSFLRNFFDDEMLEIKPSQRESQLKPQLIGKSILYASQNAQLPVDWDWNQMTVQLGNRNWKYDQWAIPILSDLPAPGTRFSASEPICTVWAEGENIQSCRVELEKRTNLLKEKLAE